MTKRISNHIRLNHSTVDGEMTLRISTSKSSAGYICSHASVGYARKSGGAEIFTTMMFQDYSKSIKPITIIQRATDKGIQTIHNETMMNIDFILDDVRKHYSMPNLEIIK